jgi:hypothetical protein
VPAHFVESGTRVVRDQIVGVGTAIDDIALDCSHFTNYVYRTVGLPYSYAESRRLYQGTESFARVSRPMPGDLVVWRGHVGIVVDPSEHTFVSKLNSGVRVTDWDTRYWKRRGVPRFFRYTGVVNAPAEPTFDAAERALPLITQTASAD